jgi:uncharacterized protein
MSSVKYENLVKSLKSLDGVVVAFSGGVDSSLLSAAAYDALGEKALAVTGLSPTLPRHDFESAQRIASDIGKKTLFTKLHEKAREEGFKVVIEGSNKDDLGDYRPGLMAIKELGIRSPFVELGIGKEDIRQMARERGLANWDKPASACLSSRIPYGEHISKERLERVGKCEAMIREMGFQQVRVRDHGVLARIEVSPEDLVRIIAENIRDRIIRGCKAAGYTFVAIDLQGYRTGAMNETLEPPKEMLRK